MQLIWSDVFALTYESIQKLSNIVGVYRLYYELPYDKNKISVFYVGQGDLKTRLFNHIGSIEDNICIKSYIQKYPCYFRYAEVAGEQDRINIERTLYEKFKPRCNLKIPEGNVIDINFV